MKSLIYSTFIVLLSISSFAQVSFNTGDAQLEANLNLINSSAKKDIKAFHEQLIKDHGAVIADIYKLEEQKLEPADIFMAYEIAKISKAPAIEVGAKYASAKSWGNIAKGYNIKPGSPEFHALKDTAKGKDASKGKSKTHGHDHKNGNGKGHGHGHK